LKKGGNIFDRGDFTEGRLEDYRVYEGVEVQVAEGRSKRGGQVTGSHPPDLREISTFQGEGVYLSGGGERTGGEKFGNRVLNFQLENFC